MVSKMFHSALNLVKVDYIIMLIIKIHMNQLFFFRVSYIEKTVILSRPIELAKVITFNLKVYLSSSGNNHSKLLKKQMVSHSSLKTRKLRVK